VVSSDDGATWQILRGPSTTDANPNGNSYGWGYTGLSGDGPSWIEEQVDLSVYAGQRILIRFEYVTDDAINHPGWAIDDISIPELGYQDDVEGGDDGWLAEGFVQTNSFVPQGYLVQLITFGRRGSKRPLAPATGRRRSRGVAHLRPGQRHHRAGRLLLSFGKRVTHGRPSAACDRSSEPIPQPCQQPI
jgi:hypothetical protein